MSFKAPFNHSDSSDSDSGSNLPSLRETTDPSYRDRSPVRKATVDLIFDQLSEIVNNIHISDSSQSSNTNTDFNFQLSNVNNIPQIFKSDNSEMAYSHANQAQALNIARPVLKPEYINMVPDFNGEAELLPRFIQICEKLVNRFYNAEDEGDFQNEYLMSSILAKIKGEAAINISSCVINKWTDLKSALLDCYADKRDCYSLVIEMTELRQNTSESVFEFYNRLQQLLNLQTSYLSTHKDENEAKILTDYFRNYALRILLRGLKEPIGSLMRTKNPKDLNTALNMLTNDFQLEVYNKNEKSKQIQRTKYNNKVFNKPSYQFPNLQLPVTNFAHNAQKPGPAVQNNRNFSNKPVPSHNVNPGTSYTRTNTNNFPKPTPMSISTTNTYRNPNNFRQSTNFKPAKRDFIFEELHNIEDPTPENPTVEFPEEENDFLGETASEQQFK